MCLIPFRIIEQTAHLSGTMALVVHFHHLPAFERLLIPKPAPTQRKCTSSLRTSNVLTVGLLRLDTARKQTSSSQCQQMQQVSCFNTPLHSMDHPYSLVAYSPCQAP